MELMLSALVEILALGIMHLTLEVLLWLLLGPFQFHSELLIPTTSLIYSVTGLWSLNISALSSSQQIS